MDESELARKMGVPEEKILRAKDHPRGLVVGLFEQGALDAAGFEKLIDAIRADVAETARTRGWFPMICRGCGARWKLKNGAPSRRYRCPKCKELLIVELSPQTLLVGVETEQPGEERETPPEALAAMEKPANLFGKYVLLAERGHGGMGRVFRAYDTELDRIVALKMLLFEDAEEVARFRREAQLAAKLDHPGIVQVHETGELEGRHFIAMQFVDGISLDETRLKMRKAVKVLRDAAQAIHFAHGRGVIHRDIKPGNILLATDGRTLVTDFGTAKKAGTTSQRGVIFGTPAYMSPEQARGETDRVDARSDVYALGATLHHLATGEPPFKGADLMKILEQVLSTEPPPLAGLNRDVTPDLEAIIQKAMRKDPELRYKSAAEMADDLDRHLRGDRVQAMQKHRPHRPPQALSPWLKREVASERVREERREFKELDALWAQIVLAKKSREELGRAVEAVAQFSKVHPELPQAHYVHARGRLLLDRHDDAERELQKALALDADFLPAHQLLGRLRLEREQADEAKAHLARGRTKAASIQTWGLAETREDKIARVLAEILATRYIDGDAPKAALLLEAAQIADPSEEFCLWLARWQDDLAKKIEWFTRALELRPQDPRAHLGRGLARHKSGALPEAIQDYTQAIEIDPSDARAWHNRGAARYARGDVDGALGDYSKAIELDPRDAGAYNNRGLARKAKRDLDGAIADHTKAIELRPRDAQAHEERGNVYYAKGELDRAIEDYTKAIELNPRESGAYNNRGLVRKALGDLSGAIEDFDKAVSLRPDWARAYSNRGLAREALARKEPARADLLLKGATDDLEKTLKLAPVGKDYRKSAETALRRIRK